jgi:hypothetical protein
MGEQFAKVIVGRILLKRLVDGLAAVVVALLLIQCA